LRKNLDELAESLTSLPAVGQRVRALQRELARLPGKTVVPRLRVFDQRLAGDLLEDLHQLRAMATPEPIAVRDLPPALRERYLGRNGKWLLRVFACDDLWEFGPLEQFTETIRRVDAEATGKPFTTVAGLRAMKNGLIRAGIYAFIVIVLVLWLDFR